ncbi:uracil-DNA glycosylase [Akkermansiaceae bacterium]|nr:uracil-DNA glycosylase [Akkermansiaceae bacterium]
MGTTIWSSFAVPTILDYLQQLKRQGVEHVEIDDEARAVLRELYTRGSARKKPVATTAAAPVAKVIQVSGATSAERIASLASQAENWPAVKALGTLRDRMVFSAGNPEARLMLVGEAPGFQEERQGQPFVGPAGQKLDAILKAMGLSREEVYLSNVCKFRPAMKNQTTGNRKPSAEEMASTLPFLCSEIDVVRPEVIVALGATASEGLLKRDQAVSRLRGEWHQFQGIPLRVSYHPSYLLHQQEGLSEKRQVWEDMLAVMEKLKLPISEKQRGFFQK